MTAQPPHAPEDCWAASVCDDNCIPPPYCDRCIMSERKHGLDDDGHPCCCPRCILA